MRNEILLTPVQLYGRWGVSLHTLAKHRSHQKGPKYLRLGGLVRYRLLDVQSFESDNEKPTIHQR